MIRPNKINQDTPLGMEDLQGRHHPEGGSQNHGGSQHHGLQSYDGPHATAKYHSEDSHQVFKSHMEKDHNLYTKRQSSRYYALTPVVSDYYSDDDVAVGSPILDVIAVKQVQESKLDPVANVFMGSLTIVGLFVLYRYLHK
jgi:hypothetical protein